MDICATVEEDDLFAMLQCVLPLDMPLLIILTTLNGFVLHL